MGDDKPVVEVESHATARVLGDVAARRVYQDEQHGGPAHDDTHTSWEWCDFRSVYEERIRRLVDDDDDPSDPDALRDFLIDIAALAVAQAEQMDRREEPTDAE